MYQSTSSIPSDPTVPLNNKEEMALICSQRTLLRPKNGAAAQGHQTKVQ